MRKFLLIFVFSLVAITSIQLWMTKDTTTQKADMAKAGEQQTQALIGGDFRLTDQSERPVKSSDFHGRLMLVFFGFTHCPDICPVTVNTLSQTMTMLKDKADQVAPLFITIDPERDTPAVMKDYLKNFDARIVALTGAPEQIKQVTELYKTYYAKREVDKKETEHDKAHDSSSHDHYTMDHSAYIYLMGKDGKYIQVFPYNISVEDLMNALKPYIQ